MKKLILSLFALSTLALINSCSSDPCKDKTATTLCTGHGTTVASGSTCACSCNTGYEGTDCSTLSTTKMVGSWTAIDNDGTNTVGPYTSAVALGTTDGSIIMSDFSHSGANVNATVSGNTITIGNQVMGTLYTVSGSGTYSKTTTGAGSIAMKYNIVQVSSGKTLSYTGTWTK